MRKRKENHAPVQPNPIPKWNFEESMCYTLKERAKRLAHWGPILALFIIFYIAIITTNAIMQWWHPFQSIGGFLHFSIYILQFFLVMRNYLLAAFVGPGFVPLFWQPDNKLDSQFLQYCSFCECFKPPRSHHCRKCDRCVLKMDHHCPWINTCCGHFNHGFFCYFLLFAPIGCLHSMIILGITIYRAIYVTFYAMMADDNDTSASVIYLTITEILVSLFGFGLALGVVVAVGGLFVVQLRSVLRNKTGIETWICEKAECRERDSNENEEFVYPYDLGRWENFKQVFTLSGNTIGNGIEWPLKKECGRFDLTIEQLLQKRQKILHSQTYRILRAYTGAVFPLFTEKCRVVCSPPCTDEARLPVQPGDFVRVTRWRKHWLYGQLLNDSNDSQKKIRKRGWFPRRCASENIREYNSSGDKFD